MRPTAAEPQAGVNAEVSWLGEVDEHHCAMRPLNGQLGRSQNPELVWFLLDYGADLNYRRDYGGELDAIPWDLRNDQPFKDAVEEWHARQHKLEAGPATSMAPS